jgi:solute carrier family 25 carnitine/acylcarnitine transporter 20/29
MFLRACSFTTFHNTLKYQVVHDPHSNGQASPRQLLLSGAIAGFFLAFIESPFDFIKTRLQCQIFEQRHNASFTPKYRNVIECAKYMVRNHGVMSLYRGFSGTMIRNVPANAMFFPANELVKRFFAQRDGIPVSEVSIGQNMIAGGCAGLCYWVGTFPLDVVKSRMQSADIQKNVSWLGTVHHVYRSGGLRAFRNGIVPCIMRAIPACGTMFTVVDYIRNKYGVDAGGA